MHGKARVINHIQVNKIEGLKGTKSDYIALQIKTKEFTLSTGILHMFRYMYIYLR